MKLNCTILLATLVLHAGCQPCDNPVCLYYQPYVLKKSKKKASPSSVYLIQIEDNEVRSVDRSLRSEGKILLGDAKFNSGFQNYNIAARKHAVDIGADKVVISWKKIGKSKGDRMVLAARTDPTVGFTTSNVFGTATSSLITSYGNAYGSSSFSGTGLSTTYNPGQSLYMRQEYEYDNFECNIKFYGSN